MKNPVLSAALALLFASTAVAWDTLPAWIDDEPGFNYTPSPSDWRKISMYQIMTDRFNDGDPSNNTVNGTYDPTYPSAIHGGDFAGIHQQLDYIQDLGITAIWISPVQYSVNAYHAYAPTDFNRIEAHFGSLEELRELIRECHARGIYVILDIVINHMADLIGSDDPNFPDFNGSGYNNMKWWDPNRRHAPPFDDLNRFHNFGEISDYDDPWQVQKGEFNPGGLDDIKTTDPQIRQDMIRIFKALIDATDADGFRIDAVKHVEEGFFAEFMPAMYAHAAYRGKENFLIFGESIDGNDVTLSGWTHPNFHFNSMLYFPMYYKMLDVFVHRQRTSLLTERINDLWRYSEQSRHQLVNFIDNHDTWRIMYDQNLDGDFWRLRPALTFIYTSLQIPCLYYGTEQGFNGGTDPWNRENMFDGQFEWGPSEGDRFDPSHEIYQFIKKLNQLREAYPALTVGSFNERWQTSDGPGIYAYSKILGDQEVVVVLNTAADGRSCTPAVTRPNGTVFVNLLNPGETVTVSGGTLAVSMLGHDQKIFAEPRAPLWVGNINTWPGPNHDQCPGEFCNPTLQPDEELWVDVETRPTRDGQTVRVFFRTTPDGAFVPVTAGWNFNSDSGSHWNANLGQHPVGTEIEFYVEATDADETVLDNQGGANFSITVVDDRELLPARVWHSPATIENCDPVTIFYLPNDGPLAQADDVFIHVGRNGWFDVVTPPPAMTLHVDPLSGEESWQVVVTPLPGSTHLDFVFNDGNGTWDNNGGHDWRIDIAHCPHDVQPTGFAVTNPPSQYLIVDHAVTTYDLHGIAENMVGSLTWTNALNRTGGSTELTHPWSLPAIPLGVGGNQITLRASVSGSGGVPTADDMAANYLPAGWIDGADGGAGWGGGWSLQSFGSAGHFIANTNDHGSLNLGANAFGLWAQTNALAEAIRAFANPLAPEQQVLITLQNNWILEGQQGVGVALRDNSGNSLIQVYFNGGDDAYTVEDADGARSTGIPWTDQALPLHIEILSWTTYRLTVGDTVTEGTFDGNLSQLRVWSYNGGTGDNYNLYFDDLMVFPGPDNQDLVRHITLERSPDGDDSNNDGIPDSWYSLYGFNPSGPSIALLDSDGDGATNREEYIADTHPNNPSSVYPNRVQVMMGSGTFTLHAGPPTSVNRHYDVFWSSSLTGTVWTPMNLNRPGHADGSAVPLTITNQTGPRFYRTGVKVP